MSPGARVVFVTYDGLLEPLGASQVLPYVRALASRGFVLEVLSFEKPDDLARPTAVAELRESLSAEGIAWTAARYHGRPTLPATLLDVVTGRRHLARWKRRARGGALVHARGYLPALMALGAVRRGASLLFDMRGFWVDERIEAGHWPSASRQARIGRWIERSALAAADHVILQTRVGIERLGTLTGRSPPPPGTVIRPCTDLAKFTPPSSVAEARSARGLPDRPTLVHAGHLGGWYDGPRTVRIGRAFVERTGGTFLILTRDAPAARELLAAEGADASVVTADPAEVPGWLAACDAGLALVRTTPAKDASFPVKLGEYLASGLAAAATAIGDLPSLADGEVLRVLGADESDGDVAAWLTEAVRRPDRQARARALAEEHMALEHGVRALAGIYRSLGIDAARVASEALR